MAASVDVAVTTVSDWKLGYCSNQLLATKEKCCSKKSSIKTAGPYFEEGCDQWHTWAFKFWKAFAIYTGFAMLFGIISVSATMLTKSVTNVATVNHKQKHSDRIPDRNINNVQKVSYLASGSGIPELKCIISGFDIPHLLDLKVLVIKAFGAVFAVATCMCLGKEGPFVHISACVAYLVGKFIPKYNKCGRRMRELLSIGCSSGLCVAFGAPIGGVLFSYEV